MAIHNTINPAATATTDQWIRGLRSSLPFKKPCWKKYCNAAVMSKAIVMTVI